LRALIELSDSSDDAETNDYLMLVAIAQNILEHKPSSDEGEGEGELEVARFAEEDEEEEPPPPPDFSPEPAAAERPDSPLDDPGSPGVFMFGGRVLNLQGVGDSDSLGYRIEALRQFLEEGIGLDKFIEAYQFVSEGCDELRPDEIDAQMQRIFPTPHLQAYCPLIQQLVVCEDSLAEE
jgi:hypothetical protein